MDEKSHVDPEAEYFAREDREKKAALAAKIEAENAAKARADRKALHAGACGKCGGALKPQDFRGVEIDVCEDCGSVLLDPGELQTLAGNDQSGVIGSLASFFSFRR
jgi:Transcription factor zinc-finger